MSFTPIVVGTGLVAWRFLEKTLPVQQQTFNKSSAIQRDVNYFQENIGSVETAEDLVKDRRLLSVALGAFGLDDDINNKFFIKKILEEGTQKQGALATKLSDNRYQDIANAFGFGNDSGAQTKMAEFPDDIAEKYRVQKFEISIGESDESMRLALNMKRNLPEIINSESSENAKWFRIMGTPPLRQVFEVALGLPASFAQIDLDQQLDIFKDKADRGFDISLSDESISDEQIDKLIDTYLLRSQITSFQGLSGASVALTLLSGN